MKKTAVYFLVLLTVCSLSMPLVPLGLSQSDNVRVAGYSYYVDQNGFLVIVGQVQNKGPNTVDPVVLTGTVTTQDGTPAYSYARVWVTDLVSQQKAPFYMDFNPPEGSSFWDPGNIAKIDLNIVLANATSSYQYPDLAITSSHGAVGASGNYSGAYVVDGEITNTGTQAASNLTVVGTFFNSTGAPVGVGYTEYLTPTTLQPSATASFRIAAFDLNQSIVPTSLKITSYELLVQTQSPILQGTAPIVTPYATTGLTQPPTAAPSNGQGPTNGQGSQTNINPPAVSQTTLITALVVVIVIVAVAAFFLSIKRRSKSGSDQGDRGKSRPVKPTANAKKQPSKPSRQSNR